MVVNTDESATLGIAGAAARLVLKLAQEAANLGDTAKADALVEAAYALFDESYRLVGPENAPTQTFSSKWPFGG